MQPFRAWSAQMRWEGPATVPPSPAFRFALWDAVHIKVVIEPPQSEIPVWQGSEVFEERMRALTQHGRLKLPPWTAKRKIDSHKASIHLDLTSTREEEAVVYRVYKHDNMVTKEVTFICIYFLCLGLGWEFSKLQIDEQFCTFAFQTYNAINQAKSGILLIDVDLRTLGHLSWCKNNPTCIKC